MTLKLYNLLPHPTVKMAAIFQRRTELSLEKKTKNKKTPHISIPMEKEILNDVSGRRLSFDVHVFPPRTGLILRLVT